MSHVAPLHPPTAPPLPSWAVGLVIVISTANAMYALIHLAITILATLFRQHAVGFGPSFFKLYPNPSAPPLSTWEALVFAVIALFSLLLIVGAVLVIARKSAGVAFSFYAACFFLITTCYVLLQPGTAAQPLAHLIFLSWPVFIIILLVLAPTRRAIALWISGRVA